MEQVNVGKSGLKVSAVGLGCNNFGVVIDAAQTKVVVHKALDLGITLFDTSDFYRGPLGTSEELLGAALAGRRDEAVVITKFGLSPTGGAPDNSRRYVLRAVEASLKRLGTDWIDVYMLHFPDGGTPLDETLRALDDIVRSGKARYIACSNLPPWRMGEAAWIARELGAHRFIASQSEYSLLVRSVEKEMIPALAHYGMGLIPYFPLASGMLTGKYLSGDEGRLTANVFRMGDRFLTDRNQEIVRKLSDYAKAHGRTLLELAMSWLTAQPAVSGIIAGATKPEQLEQNVKAAGWKLTPQELGEIDAIAQ